MQAAYDEKMKTVVAEIHANYAKANEDVKIKELQREKEFDEERKRWNEKVDEKIKSAVDAERGRQAEFLKQKIFEHQCEMEKQFGLREDNIRKLHTDILNETKRKYTENLKRIQVWNNLEFKKRMTPFLEGYKI